MNTAFPLNSEYKLQLDLRSEETSLGEISDALSNWVKLRDDIQKLFGEVSEVSQEIEQKRVETNSGTARFKIPDNREKLSAIDG